jgi:hypothetical protein
VSVQIHILVCGHSEKRVKIGAVLGSIPVVSREDLLVNLGSARADTAKPPTSAQRLPERLRSSAARRMAARSEFTRTAWKAAHPRHQRQRRVG